MRTQVLNWIRRGLALMVLAGLCLPLVTVHGCQNDTPITYTGWGAAAETPWLISLPLFPVVVIALTLLGRRPATAVGRVIFGLIRIIWAGAAGVWSSAFLEMLPPGFGKDALCGAWVVFSAWLAVIVVDMIDLVHLWRAWKLWRRDQDFPLLEDDIVRLAGWGLYLSGGCVVLAVFSAGIDMRLKGFQSLNGEAILDGAVLLCLAWWALACLAGWGLLRGLRWALVLQWVGGTGTALICIGAISLAALQLDDPITGYPKNTSAWGLVVLAAVWLVWTVWSMAVTILRRQLFVRTPPPAPEFMGETISRQPIES